MKEKENTHKKLLVRPKLRASAGQCGSSDNKAYIPIVSGLEGREMHRVNSVGETKRMSAVS